MTVLRVLIVEDSEDDAELMVLELERAGHQVVHKRIQSRQEMLECLKEGDWDLVLSDYRVPGFGGLQALDIWKQHGLNQPFIIVSGTIGEELAVEVMKSGAQDYVLKHNLKRLGPVVDHALRDAQNRRLRREAEESLRRALELLQKTFNSQKDAVFVLDDESNPTVLEVNPAATDIFGYTREELLGHKVDMLHVDEESYERFRSLVLPGVREKGYSQLGFKMRRKDGGIFSTEHMVTPISGDRGTLSGWVSVVRDVSLREAADRALKDSHELYRLTIESSDDGIAVVGPDGHILQANSRFAGMWRVLPSVLQMGGDALLAHMMTEMGASAGIAPDGLVSVFPDITGPKRDTLAFDDGRTFERYRAPVVRDGKALAQLWMFHDITLLERARESARLYLDLMGHDIRNRLQAISMSIDLVSMLFREPDMSSHLARIQEDVARCAELITKAKQTERLGESDLHQTSLTGAVKAVAETLLAQHTEITVNLDLGESEVFIDAGEHLEVLLTQLMENAVVHNPSKTKIVWVRLGNTNGTCELSIADNGPGIPGDKKLSLFDGRRRYGGIGLHMANHVVNRYGGRIAIQDRVVGDHTQGAEFLVSFPGVHQGVAGSVEAHSA